MSLRRSQQLVKAVRKVTKVYADVPISSKAKGRDKYYPKAKYKRAVAANWLRLFRRTAPGQVRSKIKKFLSEDK